MTGMACAREVMDGDACTSDEQEQVMALEALTRQAPETLRGLRTTHTANWLRCLQDRQDSYGTKQSNMERSTASTRKPFRHREAI